MTSSLLWNRVGTGNSQFTQLGFNPLSRRGKFLARVGDVGNRPAGAIVQRLQRRPLERLFVRAILQNPAEHIEPFQIHELLGDERIGKFLLQYLRIRVTDTE